MTDKPLSNSRSKPSRRNRTAKGHRLERLAKEGALVKSVMELLHARGFVTFRRNTGAMTAEYTRRDGTTRERLVRFSEPGMADIWGWQKVTGRHIEVEIKRPAIKPTPLQLQWLQSAREAGCIAFWCDSMEMAEETLSIWT